MKTFPTTAGSINPQDDDHMASAIALAREAAINGEVPVGAIIVENGVILGSGRNSCERDSDPTAHAEMVALRQATSTRNDWRLPDATLYVTLEPCVMCAGALLQSRIGRVVYAAMDVKGGAMGSLYNIADDPRLNHRIDLTWGVRGDECSAMLTDYFATIRQDRGADGAST